MSWSVFILPCFCWITLFALVYTFHDFPNRRNLPAFYWLSFYSDKRLGNHYSVPLYPTFCEKIRLPDFAACGSAVINFKLQICIFTGGVTPVALFSALVFDHFEDGADFRYYRLQPHWSSPRPLERAQPEHICVRLLWHRQLWAFNAASFIKLCTKFTPCSFIGLFTAITVYRSGGFPGFF